MARLRQTQDGHFIIRGPDFPGGVMITRQITPEGVEWLKKKGIYVNDQVLRDYIEQLEKKGHVWTGGGGTGPRGPERPAYSDDFIRDLEKWGRQGDPEKLREVLANTGNNVSLRDCFADRFLSWVISLESYCSPQRHLCDLSFEEIKENFLNQNLPPVPELHLRLLEREQGYWVLCHWIHWISEVWRIRNKNDKFPREWHGSVYEVIYNLLTAIKSISLTLPWRKKVPYVHWQDDEIALVIPPQKGPRGGQLQFKLNDIHQNLPLQHQKNSCLSEEAVHFIRNPESPTQWELVYLHDGQEWGRITDAFPLGKILLFQENGTFLSPEHIRPLPSGRSYRLLFHEEARETVTQEGIELNAERRLTEPVGWWDWEGYYIDIAKEQEKLGPYRFAPRRSPFSFTLSSPVQNPVEFAHQVPVYLGDWPEIQFGDSNTTITLEIIQEDGEPFYSEQLNPNRGNLVQLTNRKELENRYGLFTIKAYCCSERGREHQEAQFLRLPPWDWRYVDDPNGRPVKALEIRGVKNGKLEPDRNCRIALNKGDDFVIALTSYPDLSIIGLIWRASGQKTGVRFAVRLPVFRGAILEHGKRMPTWRELPLRADGDFLMTTREGDIRLELLEPLPGGEIWIKSGGNRPVKIGESKGRMARVPCHRLRDYLGCKFLTLYLKTIRDWEEFLHQSVVLPTPAPPTEFANDYSLVAALWQSDVAALEDFWQKAREVAMDSQERIPYASIFLGTHLGHVEDLDNFLTNYPVEAKCIQLRRALRQPNLTYQQLETCRAQIDKLPPDSYRCFAEGERWYRLARNHWTAAPGADNEVSRLLSQGGWGDPVTTLEAYCIQAMVALLTPRELPEDPGREISPNHYHLFFQECRRFLAASWQGEGPLRKIVAFPQPLEIILAPQDALILKACQAFLQEDIMQAARYIDQASPYAHTFKKMHTLLQARLTRLQGQSELSLSYYKQLLGELPFILDEMYS